MINTKLEMAKQDEKKERKEMGDSKLSREKDAVECCVTDSDAVSFVVRISTNFLTTVVHSTFPFVQIDKSCYRLFCYKHI